MNILTTLMSIGREKSLLRFSTRSFLFPCFAINLLSAFLSCLMFYLHLENFAVIHQLRYGLVVRISGSHPGGPGSIPGNGILFFFAKNSKMTQSMNLVFCCVM